MCAGHGTNSVGDKPTTGIYRKCNELQVVVSDGKDGKWCSDSFERTNRNLI